MELKKARGLRHRKMFPGIPLISTYSEGDHQLGCVHVLQYLQREIFDQANEDIIYAISEAYRELMELNDNQVPLLHDNLIAALLDLARVIDKMLFINEEYQMGNRSVLPVANRLIEQFNDARQRIEDIFHENDWPNAYHISQGISRFWSTYVDDYKINPIPDL